MTLESNRISAGNQSAYAVASSLVQYLLTLDDRATLLDFAVEGDRLGWDRAASKNYGVDTVGQLQREWQNWVVKSTVDPMVVASLHFAPHGTWCVVHKRAQIWIATTLVGDSRVSRHD